MRRRPKTFQVGPAMARYPWTAKILDLLAEIPLTHPLMLWTAFLSMPLWFGPVALLIVLAFICDVFFHNQPT